MSTNAAGSGHALERDDVSHGPVLGGPEALGPDGPPAAPLPIGFSTSSAAGRIIVGPEDDEGDEGDEGGAGDDEYEPV